MFFVCDAFNTKYAFLEKTGKKQKAKKTSEVNRVQEIMETTLFNDLTRDSTANNFVIDVYCRCLQIIY